MTRVFAVLGLVAMSSGCQSSSSSGEESTQTKATTEDPSAAASTGPVLDNKIAKAVASAAQASPNNPSGGGEVGPPQDGILGAARADAEVRPGELPKIVFGSAGSEPRLKLGTAESVDARLGQLELSVRTGASVLPTTALKLQLSQPTHEQGAGAVAVGLEVVSSDLAASQPAQIPESLAAEIRKLKGSAFAYQRASGKLVGTPTFTLAKGANEQLDTLMQAAAAALVDAVPAFPEQAVGAGGFWMVTSRESILATDVVAYRMVKVTEIKDGKAVLDVNTKRYLGGGGVGLPGLETATVRQFQADSSTQMTMAAGQQLPFDGRSQTTLRSLVEVEGGPRPVQVEVRSLFAFPPPAATKPNPG